MAVQIDDRKVARKLRGFERQIPFVMSYLNHNLAHDARRKIISRLDNDFVIRSKFVQKGIQVRPRKPNKRAPNATVGSMDKFMAGQAVRATQEGTQFIPMVGRGKPRPQIKSKTGKARWPGGTAWKIKDAEGKKTINNVFIGTPKNHRAAGLQSGRIRGVWRRVGKGKKRGLSLLYRIGTAVPSPGKWPLKLYVEQTVAKNLNKRAKEAIEFALRTAK